MTYTQEQIDRMVTFVKDVAENGIHLRTREQEATAKMIGSVEFIIAVDKHFKACAQALLK